MNDFLDPRDEAKRTRDNAIEARKALGLLTEEEVCSVLQLNSVSTLATWRSQGKGPRHVKLGKRVFYLGIDVNQWIQDERLRQMEETLGIAKKVTT